MLQGQKVNIILSKIFAVAAKGLDIAADFCHAKAQKYSWRVRNDLDVSWIEEKLAAQNCTLGHITNIVRTGPDDNGYIISYETLKRTQCITSGEQPQNSSDSPNHDLYQLADFLSFPVYESKVYPGMKIAANPEQYKPSVRLNPETGKNCTYLMVCDNPSGDDIAIKESFRRVKRDFKRFFQRKNLLAQEAPTRMLPNEIIVVDEEAPTRTLSVFEAATRILPENVVEDEGRVTNKLLSEAVTLELAA